MAFYWTLLNLGDEFNFNAGAKGYLSYSKGAASMFASFTKDLK
jgi:hypothetical protein